MQLYKLLKRLSYDIYECKRLAELDGTCEQCDKTKSCKSYLAIHVNINNSMALHVSYSAKAIDSENPNYTSYSLIHMKDQDSSDDLKYVDVNNVIKQTLVNLILQYIWVWDLNKVAVNNRIIQALEKLISRYTNVKDLKNLKVLVSNVTKQALVNLILRYMLT